MSKSDINGMLTRQTLGWKAHSLLKRELEQGLSAKVVRMANA
jgi:hypothetical protein